MNENANGKRGILPYDFHSESFETYIKRLEDTFKGRTISDSKKVKYLLDTLNDEVYVMLKSSVEQNMGFLDFPLLDVTYNEVKQILRDIIRDNPSIILQRYKFLNRKQEVGESISGYLASLRKLIENCHYPHHMVDIVLRDVFITGIRSKAILGKLLTENNISLENTLSIAKSLEVSHSRTCYDELRRKDSWDDWSDSRASHLKKAPINSRTQQMYMKSRNANDSWDDWSDSRASHSKKAPINPRTQQPYGKSRNANDSWNDWSDSRASHSNKKPNNPRTQSNVKSRTELGLWDDDWSNVEDSWGFPNKNHSKASSTDFSDDWQTPENPHSDPWRPWDDRRRINGRECASWGLRFSEATWGDPAKRKTNPNDSWSNPRPKISPEDSWGQPRPKTSPSDSLGNPKKVSQPKADSSNDQASKNRPQTSTSQDNWADRSSKTSPVDFKKNDAKLVTNLAGSWDDEICICRFRSRTGTYELPDTKKISSADSKKATAKPVTGSTDSSNVPSTSQPQSTPTRADQPSTSRSKPNEPEYRANLVAELNDYSYWSTLEEPNQSNNSTIPRNNQPSVSRPQIIATGANQPGTSPKTTSVDSKENETVVVTSSTDFDDVTCSWRAPKTEEEKQEYRAKSLTKLNDALKPLKKRNQSPSSTNPPNEPSTSSLQASVPSQVNKISTSQSQANPDNDPCSPQSVTDITILRQNPWTNTYLETTLPNLPIEGNRTEKFQVCLPGSLEQNYCFVRLEWYGSEYTNRAVLTCSPSYPTLQAFSLDLCEVVCVLDNGKHKGLPCISLPTTKNIEENVSPLTLYSKSTNGVGSFMLYISTVWERIHDMPRLPRKGSIWAITQKGDLYVTDTISLMKNQSTLSNRYMKEYSIKNHPHPFRMPLTNGFTNRTEITINGYVHPDAERFHVNLICGHNEDIALHFNPRFQEGIIVRNSHTEGEWGDEERDGGFNIDEGSEFILTISCMEKKIEITLNGSRYMYYRHRVSPELITDIEIEGQVEASVILYECDHVILDGQDLLWRKVKSGFRKIESFPAGVTWALDGNGNAVIFEYLNNDSPMDKCWYTVIKRTLKDLSIGIEDVADGSKRVAVWVVDEFRGEVLYRYGVTEQHPCGDGWKVVICGERMIGISCRSKSRVWGLSENGTCFWRAGITPANPMGESWRPVKPPNGCTLEKIAVGWMTVWAMDDKGDLFVRKEITPSNPGGIYWRKVPNKDDNKFVHIHVSYKNVWAVTKKGVICRRMGISADNHEGVSWNYGLSGNWLHVSE